MPDKWRNDGWWEAYPQTGAGSWAKRGSGVGDWWCALCIVRVVMMRRRGAVHSLLVRWYSVLQRGTRAGGYGTAHTAQHPPTGLGRRADDARVEPHVLERHGQRSTATAATKQVRLSG